MFLQRPWVLRLAPIVLTIAIAASVIVVELRGDGGSGASSATLPTACENFARASELFASGGSAQSRAMTGGRIFTSDAQMDAKQILRDLLDACDSERAGQ